MLDDRVGGIHDGLRRAVVLLQLEGLRRGVVVAEREDILNLRTSERIDTLCIVTHNTHPAVVHREAADDDILGIVGVLILIHKDILELLLILRQHIGAVTQQDVGLQQQIVEVHSSVSLAAAAVLHIHLAKLRHLHLSVLGGKARVRHIGTRGNQGILGVGDTRENTRRLVLVVSQIALLADCLDEILAVVGLIDGECLGVAYTLGILPQDTRKDRVESTHSDVVRRRAFDHLLNAFTHLACRLVGEGEGEDVPGLDTLLQHICYA